MGLSFLRPKFSYKKFLYLYIIYMFGTRMNAPGMNDPGMSSGNEMGEVADDSPPPNAIPPPGQLYSPAFKDYARGRILFIISAMNLRAKTGNAFKSAYNSVGNAASGAYNYFRGTRGGQGQDSLAAARGAAYRAAMNEILTSQMYATDESLGNASTARNMMNRMRSSFAPANNGTFSGGRRRRGKNRKTRKSKR